MDIPKAIMSSRKKLATDLRKLSEILYNYFPTAEISSFENAITQLRNDQIIPQIPEETTNSNLWGYNISSVIFKFDSIPDHTVPVDCKDLKLILDINVAGDCNDINNLNDPFKWLEFNIIIEGTKFDKVGKRQLITSYHLDRHIFNEGDGEPEYPHPIYHFQFGGKKLKEHNGKVDTGDLLVLDGPRVSHYPMEAILGIDFTISNFFPHTWKKIRDESSEYNNLIEEYQEKFLKPYIHTYASHWLYTHGALLNTQVWNPISICPQLF